MTTKTTSKKKSTKKKIVTSTPTIVSENVTEIDNTIEDSFSTLAPVDMSENIPESVSENVVFLM